jgi:hypothetical protein
MGLKQFRSVLFRFRFSEEFRSFQNSLAISTREQAVKLEEILFCPRAVHL